MKNKREIMEKKGSNIMRIMDLAEIITGVLLAIPFILLIPTFISNSTSADTFYILFGILSFIFPTMLLFLTIGILTLKFRKVRGKLVLLLIFMLTIKGFISYRILHSDIDELLVGELIFEVIVSLGLIVYFTRPKIKDQLK